MSKTTDLSLESAEDLAPLMSAAEQRYWKLVINLREVIVELDPNGVITFLNPAWEEHLRLPPMAALGRPMIEFVPPAWRSKIGRQLAGPERVLDGCFELPLMAATGDVVWFECCLRDTAGECRLGVLHDISGRRQVEEQLREQQAELEEQSRMADLRADLGQALNQNLALEEVLKNCCEVVLGRTRASFVRVWTLNEAEDVLELKSSVGRYTHLDGAHARIRVGEFKIGRIAATRAPHLTNDVPSDPYVSDPEWARREGMVAFAGHPLICGGRLVGVLALFASAAISARTAAALTVTADLLALGIVRKRAEAAVRDQEARHRAVMQSALDCIITIDRHGRVIEFNPAAEQTFGYTRDEVIGRELVGLIIPDIHRNAHTAGLQRFLATGESQVLRQRLVGLPAVRKDGTHFPTELTIVPIELDGEQVFTAFLRDITKSQMVDEQRLAVEADLQRAKETAEAASLAKSQFMANMSHELRTPLSAILGYTEILLDPSLTHEQRVERKQAILRNGRHLLRLINDVLDLSKIEAGKLELESLPCRVWRVVRECLSSIEPAANEKGLTLLATAKGPLPYLLHTDPTRLRQVLDNLLSNAVKFTAAGTIELRVRLDDSAGRLLFEVRDQGLGITASQMLRLFQPFTQADASTTRQYGGTGLGLNICKRLATALGGDLTVRSEYGKGSCFTFLLPVSTGEVANLVMVSDLLPDSTLIPKPARQLRLAGHILLAEDSLDNQRIIRYFLERAGASVEVVVNGREAVDRALAGRFDLVLMDMQMPEMDGYTAARQLRLHLYDRPVIALTANAMAGDEQRCLEAGCTGYLPKPVDNDRLVATIHTHLRRGSRTRPPLQAQPSTQDDLVELTLQPPADPTAATIADMPDILADLLREYRATLPEAATEVRQAASEPAKLAALAHKVRGTAGMYELRELAARAGEVEDALRKTIDLPTRRRFAERLATALEQEGQR